jgi:acyl-CoA synthetase (NDP forming)
MTSAANRRGRNGLDDPETVEAAAIRPTRDLDRLFRPKTVAIIGASDDSKRIGGRVLLNLTRHGYAGEIIPVNPRARTVQGHAALHSVDSLGPVDLAVISVNARVTLDVVPVMLRAGTRAFLSFAGGDIVDEIGRILQPYDDACFVGPNSNGIWSVQHRLIASFGGEAEREHIEDGPVAIVSHSGSLGGAVARRLEDEQIGIRYLVSAGNEANLSVSDFVRYFLQDQAIRVIGAYVEGVKDGQDLLDAVGIAMTRGIQVVVQLTGRSTVARRTTVSHTGKALASPVVARAVLADRGAVVVDSTADLIDACRYASAGGAPRVPRVGAIGISGGMLANIVDACEDAGLPLAEFAPDTVAALRSLLPDYARLENPADVTGAVLERPTLLEDCTRQVAADPVVDAVVVGLDNKGYQRIGDGGWIRAIAGASSKPIALVLWDAPARRDLETERMLLDAGVVVSEPSSVAKVLRWLCRTHHAELKRAPSNASARHPVGATGLRGVAAVRSGELKSWEEQIAFADSLGLRTPRTGVAHSRDLPPGLGEFTYPVVVKPLPTLVKHKSDRGLVHLWLSEPASVERAIDHVRRAIGPEIPILVQEMTDGVEVLLSASRDADWGPILTLGFGGTLVEAVRDLAPLPLPADRGSMLRALRGTCVWALLNGHRGRPPADVDSLLDAAVALQEVFLASRLREIELNPVIVGSAGTGAWFVDLVTTSELCDADGNTGDDDS